MGKTILDSAIAIGILAIVGVIAYYLYGKASQAQQQAVSLNLQNQQFTQELQTLQLNSLVDTINGSGQTGTIAATNTGASPS